MNLKLFSFHRFRVAFGQFKSPEFRMITHALIA